MSQLLQRVSASALCIAALTVTTGCATNHKPVRNLKAGQILPVFVEVSDAETPAAGQVHYRQPAEGEFNTIDMTARPGELYALLPTAALPPGVELLYYINVHQGDKTYTHGSPGSPYVVNILDPLQWATQQIKSHCERGRAFEPLTMHADTGALDAQSVTLLYIIPGIIGEVSAPMRHHGGSHWILHVPPASVHPGTWSYALLVTTPDGQTLRVPGGGYRQFNVNPPARKDKQDKS